MPNGNGTAKANGGGAVLVPLLTCSEVGAILRLHPKTVERWARDSRLPCYRVGGRVLFDPGGVASWLQERRSV